VFGLGDTDALARIAYRDVIDELRTLMNPTLSPYAVVVTLEAGSSPATRTFTARPLNMAVVETIPSLVAEVSLEWECVDAADF
jgi:hypothetical protein